MPTARDISPSAIRYVSHDISCGYDMFRCAERYSIGKFPHGGNSPIQFTFAKRTYRIEDISYSYITFAKRIYRVYFIQRSEYLCRCLRHEIYRFRRYDMFHTIYLRCDMFRKAERYSIGNFPHGGNSPIQFTFAVGEHIVFIYRIHISHSRSEYIVFTLLRWC